MNPLHFLLRWVWRVKLNLIEREMLDVDDEMADALHQHNYGVYRALAEFYADLTIEAMHLRTRLGLSAFSNR